VEALLHEESAENKLLIFNRYNKKERFGKEMPHRAIGVVYDPDQEKYSNYVPTILNARYDAFVYIDESKALHPLHLHPDLSKTPETYPFEY
jgi:erythromycin esterase-like protein